MSVQPMAASGDTKCTIQAYFERQEAWDATFLLSALLSTPSSIQMRCPEKWAHGGVQTRARQVRLELTEAGPVFVLLVQHGKGWHGALRPLTNALREQLGSLVPPFFPKTTGTFRGMTKAESACLVSSHLPLMQNTRGRASSWKMPPRAVCVVKTEIL